MNAVCSGVSTPSLACPSMVRIATGADTADTAFLTVTRGFVAFHSVIVNATVTGDLPADDPSEISWSATAPGLYTRNTGVNQAALETKLAALEGSEDAVFGLLVLGSPDPTRYQADMGTEFLARIGELASAALSRLRPSRG